ncbi:MAG TPA: glycosyltransferase family 2 protein [Pirellulales bacterium]|nr:glycosyltransferase family 2 protein [Pirellulales bacterium]
MMTIHLVVLNFNGRELLAECLPSLLRAAAMSRHKCEVIVVDNGSRDDSVSLLRTAFSQVRVVERPNRGLCSFNEVLASLTGPVAVLLNNDIKLADDCIDPLVEPLLESLDASAGAQARCFMTAPLCWLFDGASHEGLQAAVAWRWGLTRTVIDFPGSEHSRHRAGLTAAAGPVLAVDRRIFLELNGFDPLYLPGRLEDLDFAFRGFLAGYVARYVPEAVAYHKGQASFDAAYGPCGSLAWALRNTLLFQWKNLRHPWHVARHLLALPARFAFDWLRAPFTPRRRRWAFTRAFVHALARLWLFRQNDHKPRRSLKREREFFRRFGPRDL